MLSEPLRITRSAYGDSALMLAVSGADLESRRAYTREIRAAVLDAKVPAVRDVVAGFESLLVQFDCLAAEHAQLGRQLDQVVAHVVPAPQVDSRNRFVVPTVFGGACGPDLDPVARELGISLDEVVSIFTSAVHTVDLLGAGIAPMMHGACLPDPVRRCAVPREHVDEGAVMVAGHNAIISPAPGPSGWRIVGRTPLRLCDIRREPVAHYAPGDEFVFRAIPESDWSVWAGRPLLPGQECST